MANPFNEMGGRLVENILSSILWFGVAVILIAAVTFIIWYKFFYRNRFDIQVKIISDRADDNDSVMFDKAAILKQFKTKLPYFRLWGLKKNFPVPKFNVLQKTADGDYLEMYRQGENRFFFLTPSKVIKTRVIKSDGKVYPIADHEQQMVDADMEYWNAKRKDENNKMFSTDNLIWKLIEFAPQVISMVMLIFILYIFMDNLPAILGQLSELVDRMSDMQRVQMAEVTTGTIVSLL